MESKKRNQTQPSTPHPPRTLNVQSFAESRSAELQSLHAVVSNRLHKDFRSRKRKRTTSHDERVAKSKFKKKRKSGQNGDGDDKDCAKKVPRRVRRRVELRRNMESGFCMSRDGTRRLRTHLWHAKRFAMAKAWGFYVPMGLLGRGRGSRALLKWYRKGALLHDASYYSAVQLEGPQESLLSILKMVLVSSSSVDRGMKSTCILSGVSYGSAMLHYVGAPSSEVIAPVTYMWRPFMSYNNGAVRDESHSIDGLGTSGSSSCSSFRQLWIWIHAAAFNEGFDSIQIACQKHMSETGASVNCLSLEGQLGKLEVMGENAMKYLQQILQPVPRASDGLTLKRCSVLEVGNDTHLRKSFILEHAMHLPSYSILSLTVKDPRVLPNQNIEFISEESPVIVNGDVLEEKSDNSFANIKQSKDKDKDTDEASILCSWLKDEANNILLSDNKELWEIGNIVTPPVDENFLSTERHRRRMKFFQLDNISSALPSAETAESAGLCPILLLKLNNQKGVNVGWSIILPLSWVKACWIPLVTRGVRAIGLREKHWIASDVGLPCFPFDFPDTNAYSSFMATQATASDQNAERRPPAMRPFRVPIPPPWNCIRSTFDLQSTSIEETQAAGGQVFLAEASPGTKNRDLEISELDNSLIKGFFVIRTSNILSVFLNYIYRNNVLLFSNNALMGKKAEFFKAQEKLSIGSKGATHIPLDRKLCFFRVLLHAYKDGSFEEGSVVCAPHLGDIELWTTRSDETEGLQILQSSVASYFIQQPSGEWQLDKPEKHSTAAETHRLPIGFVTSGFVRGSSKPAAVALCETGLLAQLRSEQWESVQVKHRRWEIFVLVRNLRSSAYRLALATIVLERQEDDLNFM